MLKSFFSTLFSGLLFISGTSLSSLPIMANEDETEFFEETGSAVVEMYRLYNLNTGEHFYTLDAKEKDSLLRSGWQYEGIGWYAPDSSNTPVYRLYNRNASDHHYTADVQERDSLIKAGWQYEGVGWYSDDAKRIPLYRQYNPKARQAGAHNYTTSQEENDVLCSLGWKHEGIAWYGVGAGKPAPVQNTPSPSNQDSYGTAYGPILDAAKKLVENKGYGEGYPEELYGVRECSWNGKMDDFGYTIQDLSGDGIPELAIVHKKDKIVLALYTLVNGAPSNTFYSWSRSRNYYAGGSSFVFEGSMSASSSVVGTFSISQDGRNVVNKQTYHNQPTSKFDSQKQTLPSTSLSQWK